MNAKVSIGITKETGKTDVLIVRNERQEPVMGAYLGRIRVHNDITDASFSRLARLIAKRGTKTHETGTLIHYTVK